MNAIDYSGYPDCRPEFLRAFEKLAALATRAGVTGSRLKIHAPLLRMSKAEIIRKGQKLGVDFAKTWSCYRGQRIHCGTCGTCHERREAFLVAKLPDPTVYRAAPPLPAKPDSV